MADACASTMFHFFSLLDGVADPELTDVGEWKGAALVRRTDDEDEQPMLHDEFYATYDTYEEFTEEDE